MFKIKLSTAVPPPSKIERRALNDPTTMLKFPFNIDQTDSKTDINVPIFCLTNSVKPFMLNISETIAQVS